MGNWNYLDNGKIIDKIKAAGVHVSLEVFPPKKDVNYGKIQSAVDEIATLKPSFISVTYGAGGGTSKNTISIASHIQHDLGVDALAHLTCCSADKDTILKYLEDLKEQGIRNILALRGDYPEGTDGPAPGAYKYASELIQIIKENGDFGIGAACYPEGHIESADKKEDILHLKEKVDAGADFLTTQMFFDNSILYNFLYRIREVGINVPILPGIMPVTSASQIANIRKLSGTAIPQRFINLVDHFGNDPKAMQQAGIAYATDQIIDLIANGIRHIHIYTMNKPEVARGIMENLSEIIQ